MKGFGILLLLLAFGAQAASFPPNTFSLQPCGFAGNASLHRADAPTSPVVFVLALGGWFAGNDRDTWAQVPLYTDAGLSVVTTETHDVGRGGNALKILEGLDCTIALVRRRAAEHPEWGLAMDRIGMAGMSAGGHITQLFTTLGKVAAGVSWDAPSDLPKLWASSAARLPDDGDAPSRELMFPLMALAFQGVPGLARLPYHEFSPVNQVTARSCPLAMIHGTLDKTVPLEQSEWLLARYRAAGVSAELRTLAVNHSAQGPDAESWNSISAEVVRRHFQRYLRN